MSNNSGDSASEELFDYIADIMKTTGNLGDEAIKHLYEILDKEKYGEKANLIVIHALAEAMAKELAKSKEDKQELLEHLFVVVDELKNFYASEGSYSKDFPGRFLDEMANKSGLVH